mgnify:CR=1 FL=1
MNISMDLEKKFREYAAKTGKTYEEIVGMFEKALTSKLVLAFPDAERQHKEAERILRNQLAKPLIAVSNATKYTVLVLIHTCLIPPPYVPIQHRD